MDNIIQYRKPMTNKKSSANLEATIVATDAATGGAKVEGAKVTTNEELFRGHEMLPRTEQGAIILTDELFRNLAASHTYKYGKRTFKVLEKRSGTERGGKTLYKVQSGADTFTDFSIEELKQEFGCEYRRAKDGSSNDKTPAGKLYYLLSKSEVVKLAEDCKDPQILATLTQLRGLTGSEKKAEDKARAEAKAKADAEAKTQKETDKTVDMLRKQGMPEDFIKMYLANRK